MTEYYRVMLGKGSAHAQDCFDRGFVGVDFEIKEDLTGRFGEHWRDFNKRYIPVFLDAAPGKSKVAAGLACGMLWTLCRFLQEGDVVLAPTGAGQYRVGVIAGPYFYAAGEVLFHRRPVTWRRDLISRDELSPELLRSMRSAGTLCRVTQFAAEIETLVGPQAAPELVAADPSVEDVATFALERHLEDFLVSNWKATEFGRTHRIYEVDGEPVGQQFPTDTGPIDILAQSLDGKELLVVELKRGRASDAVVGQIQRYMGYVLQDLAEPGQTVRGVIVALEDDLRLRRALAVAPNVDFYRYEVSFRLRKA